MPSPSPAAESEAPEASRPLMEMRQIQDRLEGRVRQLEGERRHVLEQIRATRERVDATMELIYLEDHWHCLQLLRATQAELGGVKRRYHSVRQALYAADHARVHADVIAADALDGVHQLLDPDAAVERSLLGRDVDEALDLLSFTAGHQAGPRVAIPAEQWAENLRLVDAGLARPVAQTEVRA